MRRKIEHKWEQMDEQTTRCQVMGGWLVHVTAEYKNHISCTMSFLHDPDHQWHITNPYVALQPV